MLGFFALAIFFITMSLFWNIVSTEATVLWDGAAGARIKGNMDAAANNFDWLLITVWFALHMGILVSAFLLKTHPAMYIVTIILIGALALVAGPLSNTWEELSLDTNLASTITGYPKTNFVMQNLPPLEIVWCLITGIVLIALARGEKLI